MSLLRRNALARSADLVERRKRLSLLDPGAVTRIHFALERRKVHSVEPFASLPDTEHEAAVAFLEQLEGLLVVPEPRIYIERDETVYERNPDIEGPMNAFGYSFIEDKLGVEELGELNLLKHSTPYGSGGMFAYEALNFVDGERTVSDIRDWLVAELGTVSLEDVAEYLQVLESIDVISAK
jgi:hypothetical protein